MPSLSDNTESIEASESEILATNPSSIVGGKKHKKKLTKKLTKKSGKKLNRSKKSDKKLNRSKKGGKKPLSKWILHVKKYAAEHNIKFGEALKKASKTFKK
jgi:hypothetical protein|tara:strand:- start:1146 stop:1448 length:303 start_codon:yes stop_codon:yes gene_type:complete